MIEHVRSTYDVADAIFQSVDDDAEKAFMAAVGTLAQVLFQIVADENREAMLEIAKESVGDYMRLLDQVEGIDELSERRRH